MESTPGQGVMNIIEMTTKELEYYIHLDDNAVAGLRELILILKEFLPWVKCYHISSHTTQILFAKGRVNQCGKFYCCLILGNCHSHLHLTFSKLISQQP